LITSIWALRGRESLHHQRRALWEGVQGVARVLVSWSCQIANWHKLINRNLFSRSSGGQQWEIQAGLVPSEGWEGESVPYLSFYSQVAVYCVSAWFSPCVDIFKVPVIWGESPP
jgi:hypothetical protein